MNLSSVQTTENCKLALLKKLSDCSNKNKVLFDYNLTSLIFKYYEPLEEQFEKPFANEFIELSENSSIDIVYISWNMRQICANYISERPKFPVNFTGYGKRFSHLKETEESKSDSESENDLEMPSLQQVKLKRHTRIYTQKLYYANGKLYWICGCFYEKRLPVVNALFLRSAKISDAWNYLMMSLEN